MGLFIEKELEIMNVEQKKSKKGDNYSLITILDDEFKTMDLYSADIVTFKRGEVKNFELKVDRVGYDTKISIVSVK